MNSFILKLLMLFSISVLAQDNLPVTELLEKSINITQENGKIEVYETTKKINRFGDNVDINWAKESVYFDENEIITSITAKTYNVVNGREKISRQKKIEESDVLQRGIFYSGLKSKNIVFPNVGPGSKTILEYTKKLKDIHLISSIYLGDKLDIENFVLNVNFPNNVDFKLRKFNLLDNQVNIDVTKENNFTICTYSISDLKRYNLNKYQWPSHYLPILVPYIKSYISKGESIGVLSSESDLYKWYVRLLSNVDNKGVDKVKNITNSLINDITKEEDVIKKIYYYVQNNISYIAFEDGMNGFIPENPAVTINNKYGDCKAMAYLLKEMLQYAGVKAYPTWIGTRRKPFLYKDLPTPVADNHMITTVITKEQDTVFLDPTSKYLIYPYPSPFIQSKEALIGIDSSTFKINKVPVNKPNLNLKKITNNFSISELGNLEGVHELKFYGHSKLDALNKLNYTDVVGYKDILNDDFNIGKKNTNFNITSIEDQSLYKDFVTINVTSTTPKILKKVNDQFLLYPSFDQYLVEDLVTDDALNYNKEIDFKETISILSNIQIPDNKELVFIPEGISIDTPDYSLVITYEVINNVIKITKKYKIDTITITPDKINEWNSFVKNIIKSNKQVLIFKSIKK